MLEKLFNQHASALHRYLLRKKCTPSLASDLVQDTFLRIAQLENMERILCAPSYLFRVAHNLMIDHHRRYGEKRFDSDAAAYFDTLVDEASGPEEQALDAEWQERQTLFKSRANSSFIGGRSPFLTSVISSPSTRMLPLIQADGTSVV